MTVSKALPLIHAGSERMPDPEVEDSFLESLTQQLPLGDPEPPARVIRIVDAEPPIDPKGTKKGVVAKSEACSDGDIAQPEIPHGRPEVPEIKELDNPDLVEHSIAQVLEKIGAQLHAPLEREVSAQLGIPVLSQDDEKALYVRFAAGHELGEYPEDEFALEF